MVSWGKGHWTLRFCCVILADKQSFKDGVKITTASGVFICTAKY